MAGSIARDYLMQRDFRVRCEWGANGVRVLAPNCDVVVIVDVLSFSTCVDIATDRGATIFPHVWESGVKDASAGRRARELGALLAGDNPAGLSLLPSSLERIEADCRLVLPSPNGSFLSTLVGSETTTIAGCLRNARAVAEYAAALGRTILLVPAGERWSDGLLRPSFEDQCGAGAIIHYLPADLERSPDAAAAQAVFENVQGRLLEALQGCGSGLEKHERQQARDVVLAAELNVSRSVPVLRDGAYLNEQRDEQRNEQRDEQHDTPE